MIFGRKEGQDVLDKSEEIAAFGGQDGKAIAKDGNFAVVRAVPVSVRRGKIAPFPPFAYGQGVGHGKKGQEELVLPGVFEVGPLEVIAIGLEVQEEAFDLPTPAVELGGGAGRWQGGQKNYVVFLGARFSVGHHEEGKSGPFQDSPLVDQFVFGGAPLVHSLVLLPPKDLCAGKSHAYPKRILSQQE